MTQILKKRWLLDMPYEILFEIFRRLPKNKLRKIFRFCPKLRDVAGDARLWKDVYIKYEQKVVAFEALYSEPWPVKVVDVQATKIEPPVSSEAHQVVKVKKLNLSRVKANKVTMDAILAKYQCTELHFDYYRIDSQNHSMGIAPEAFSKQTDLEVLSLAHIRNFVRHSLGLRRNGMMTVPTHLWLAPILDNCKNLKILNLSYNYNMDNLEMLGFVRHLPTSLEKLFIVDARPEDFFFESLGESAPNLKELALNYAVLVECRSLLKFQYLEVLYVYDGTRSDISAMCRHLSENLMKLKGVYIGRDEFLFSPETKFVKHLTTLEPQSIIIGEIYCRRRSQYPQNGNLWRVLKAT